MHAMFGFCNVQWDFFSFLYWIHFKAFLLLVSDYKVNVQWSNNNNSNEMQMLLSNSDYLWL